MIKSGSKKISLRQEARELPRQPIPEELAEPIMILDGDELSDLLGISFMADHGDMVASLSGTYLLAKDNTLHAVAASSFRFAKTSLPTKYSKTSSFLLPASTGKLLPYYLHDDDTVEIYARKNTMWFVTHRFTFSCNGINAKYPYTAIVEHLNKKRPNTVSVNKYELENAIKVCQELADVTNVKGKRVVFDIDSEYESSTKKGTITLSTSAENEIGDMEWTITTENNEGKSFSFALNIDYLDDILTVLNRLAKSGILADFEGTNLVNISVGEKENESAIFFSSNTKNSVFLIMPMRV
jgi:DNA polymerase III sliding clamp (beta) subunit (PCNA family)